LVSSAKDLSGSLTALRPNLSRRSVGKRSQVDKTIAAVQAWQANETVHPLTCGNDSSHRLLEAVKQGRKVFLKCPDCEYVQADIPYVVVVVGAKMKPGKPRGPIPKTDLVVRPK
jgi:hypothetical protein